MSNSIKDTICNRKSIRTFDGRKITAEDKSKLEEIIRTADNPFGVPVDFMLLDAKENGLSSPAQIFRTIFPNPRPKPPIARRCRKTPFFAESDTDFSRSIDFSAALW